MTKAEFKKKWDSDETITYDDCAKCAVEWGLCAMPQKMRLDSVLNMVLRAAGIEPIQDDNIDAEA